MQNPINIWQLYKITAIGTTGRKVGSGNLFYIQIIFSYSAFLSFTIILIYMRNLINIAIIWLLKDRLNSRGLYGFTFRLAFFLQWDKFAYKFVSFKLQMVVIIIISWNLFYFITILFCFTINVTLLISMSHAVIPKFMSLNTFYVLCFM